MPVTIEQFDGITLSFDQRDRAIAQRLRQTCQDVFPMLQARWGLPAPTDLWLYVMTQDWLGDIWRAAPGLFRVPLVMTLPVWYLRIQRMWKFVGGWQQQFGRRRVVGVKSPDLLLASDRSIGERIYVPVPDLEDKVTHLACHELTHALTAHLRLPAWLNEGLAMAAVDQFAGKPTIKPETLTVLNPATGSPTSGSYRKVNVHDSDSVVYLYVRGYWITSFLEETQPGLLKTLLLRRVSHKAIEQRIAQALGLDLPTFWMQVDKLVMSHFKA